MIYQFTTFEPPLGVEPGASTPKCFAYSATNRCQPANFMGSTPAMAAIGLPTRNRSRTSKQMCQPAAQPKIPMKTNKKEKLQNAYWLCFRRWFPTSFPPLSQFVIEPEINVYLLISRAVKRTACGLRQAASGIDSVPEQHQLRMPVGHTLPARICVQVFCVSSSTKETNCTRGVGGYFLFSGIGNIGDWAEVVAGWQPAWAWRVGLAALGIVTYFFLFVPLSLRELRPFLGRDAKIRVRRARQLTLVPYLTAGVLACVAGALNPVGPHSKRRAIHKVGFVLGIRTDKRACFPRME
jgi:hypothetical protein